MAMDTNVNLKINEKTWNKVKQNYPRVIMGTALDLLRNARKEAPVDTGTLRASHQITSQRGMSGNGDPEIRLGPTVDYAVSVHEGSPPRTIVPVKAKALHFKVKGVDVFAKRVQHPGTKGNPWLDRAIKTTKGNMRSIIARTTK